MSSDTRRLDFCTLSARPGNECAHCIAEAAEPDDWGPCPCGMGDSPDHADYCDQGDDSEG